MLVRGSQLREGKTQLESRSIVIFTVKVQETCKPNISLILSSKYVQRKLGKQAKRGSSHVLVARDTSLTSVHKFHSLTTKRIHAIAQYNSQSILRVPRGMVVAYQESASIVGLGLFRNFMSLSDANPAPRSPASHWSLLSSSLSSKRLDLV